MASMYHNPTNIVEALRQKLFPTVMMWNRLEGSTRKHDFDRALKAEVRDALWLLCKQWQMGEFKGEDAGSPVFSRVKIESSSFDYYSLGNGSVKKLEQRAPLETLVEQKPVPMERNTIKISLDIRLQLGKYWLKLLRSKSLSAYASKYISQFGFSVPLRSRDADFVHAHKEELQQWQAISGRCVDGFELVKSLKQGVSVITGVTLDDPAHEPTLIALGKDLVAYYTKVLQQPEDANNTAWLPDRLEYKASIEDKNGGNTLAAEEYYHGHLDWFAFNLNEHTANPTAVTNTVRDIFVPAPVAFDGMPDKRWWKFEDNKTSFGNISPTTTDLSKLLFVEFGLSFANDWFLLPVKQPIGSIAQIKGLTVTNNFGEHYWIEATEKESNVKSEWSVFRQTSDGSNGKLFLCPSATKVQESNPTEEVWLIRDEMANMVWGIEKVVPSSLGKGVPGSEYALQKRKFHESFIQPATTTDYVASVYYKAMTDVPEHWIPFIPVHRDGHNRAIQLQRSSMLRIIEGDVLKPQKVKPLSSLLREGLDSSSTPKAYFIHEEEVTRSGTRITQSFQRTRWLDGSVHVWFGARKKTGRGEGHSGLSFDQLETSQNK